MNLPASSSGQTPKASQGDRALASFREPER